MAGWPTLTEQKRWMLAEGLGDGGDDAFALQTALDSATELIEEQLDPELMPVDGCPASVRLAIFIRTAALYMRRQSPTGIVSFGPDSVIRVNRMDADVDQQIAAYRMFPVA